VDTPAPPAARDDAEQLAWLQSLSNLLPDGVLAADAAGSVVMVNQQAASFLGVDAAASLGAPVEAVLRLQDHDGRSWLERNRPFEGLATRTGVPEQTWLNAAGEEVLTTARVLRRRPLGPVSGVAIALRSGRGRARLDRERSDLVATLAHELRSPLSGVKGFAQVMLSRWEQLQDAQKKLMLTTVHSDADRLSRLITELLDVARLDTGRLSISPRTVDADVLIQRCAASVQAATSRPVAHRRDDGLPPLWADPDKFSQVVTNLLENGVRHGSGQVSVWAEPLGDGLRVVVEDEGEGIPAEMRQRVLTKYVTGGAGGSGLGLYIVAGLVAAHGGTLAVEDAAGGGARIVLDWPGPPD